jgi:hypothetical protein
VFLLELSFLNGLERLREVVSHSVLRY